jgi:hypothetical protein
MDIGVVEFFLHFEHLVAELECVKKTEDLTTKNTKHTK